MVACPTTRLREHRLISFMGLINDHDPRSETKPWIVSCLEIGISFQNWRLWLVRVGPDISSRQFNCFCGGLCVGMLDLVIRQRKKGFSRSFKLVVFREAIMEDFEGKISDCSIWDLVERFTFRYKLNNSNSNDVTKAVNTNQLYLHNLFWIHLSRRYEKLPGLRFDPRRPLPRLRTSLAENHFIPSKPVTAGVPSSIRNFWALIKIRCATR